MTAALGLIIVHERICDMNELLKLMLVHYYQDSKRCTNATVTRRLDSKIRKLSSGPSPLHDLVVICKKTAEANKRQERTAAKKTSIPHMHHGNPHVTVTPCGSDPK